jgi:hypothetical protein
MKSMSMKKLKNDYIFINIYPDTLKYYCGYEITACVSFVCDMSIVKKLLMHGLWV